MNSKKDNRWTRTPLSGVLVILQANIDKARLPPKMFFIPFCPPISLPIQKEPEQQETVYLHECRNARYDDRQPILFQTHNTSQAQIGRASCRERGRDAP